jgi:hypothetical protein
MGVAKRLRSRADAARATGPATEALEPLVLTGLTPMARQLRQRAQHSLERLIESARRRREAEHGKREQVEQVEQTEHVDQAERGEPRDEDAELRGEQARDRGAEAPVWRWRHTRKPQHALDLAANDVRNVAPWAPQRSLRWRAHELRMGGSNCGPADAPIASQHSGPKETIMSMQRTLLALALVTSLSALGCMGGQSHETNSTTHASTAGGQHPGRTQRQSTAQADRARLEQERQERARLAEMDRRDDTSAMDQGESAEDLEITRQIRAAVVGDSSLSVGARNVTIVTRGAVVSLRGNVTSNAERDAIDRHAHEVAGVHRVDNMLSVSAPQQR